MGRRTKLATAGETSGRESNGEESQPGDKVKERMNPRRRKIMVGVAVSVMAGVLVWRHFFPPEPLWKGHRLSEWLDASDTNWRFPEGDGRRYPFTDEEIREAIDGIGPRALPFLLPWLDERNQKPGRFKSWANSLLDKQSLANFRFRPPSDRSSLAIQWFLECGNAGESLVPELARRTHSPDPETRLLAYEAAFFARPDKEVFLPLAERALHERDKGVRAMAAQWLLERFPAEARKVNLRDLFPEFRDTIPNQAGLQP